MARCYRREARKNFALSCEDCLSLSFGSYFVFYSAFQLLEWPLTTVMLFCFHRYSATKAVLFSMFLTCFEACNIPVFWPILVMYFCILFTLTMKRQIRVNNSSPAAKSCQKYYPWPECFPSCSIWSNTGIFRSRTARRVTREKTNLVNPSRAAVIGAHSLRLFSVSSILRHVYLAINLCFSLNW